jgi:hypothetical protein
VWYPGVIFCCCQWYNDASWGDEIMHELKSSRTNKIVSEGTQKCTATRQMPLYAILLCDKVFFSRHLSNEKIYWSGFCSNCPGAKQDIFKRLFGEVKEKTVETLDLRASNSFLSLLLLIRFCQTSSSLLKGMLFCYQMLPLNSDPVKRSLFARN